MDAAQALKEEKEKNERLRYRKPLFHIVYEIASVRRPASPGL